MNYDNERTNRVFSLFLIGVMIAFLIGGIFGVIVTILIEKIQ